MPWGIANVFPLLSISDLTEVNCCGTGRHQVADAACVAPISKLLIS